MKNPILEKYIAGEPSLGTFSGLGSTAAALALAQAGLDFVILDTEHSAMDASAVCGFIQTLALSGTSPLVRINSQSPAWVQWMLDGGAMGIVVPRMQSAEEAAQMAALAKFPPAGTRGFGPSMDAGFMKGRELSALGMDGFMKERNNMALVLIQCETAGCLSQIEEVCALSNVDGILIGPYDLSIAMGIPGRFDAPEFKEALERILAACKKEGKLSMIFTGNAKAVKGFYDRGFDSVVCGVDTMALIDHYRAMVKETMI